jgi:SAM-dependent methyltransferase
MESDLGEHAGWLGGLMPSLRKIKLAAKTGLPTSLVRLLQQIHRRLQKPRPYPDDYSYQANHIRRLPDHGIILDVGSGHLPFPDATMLSDRFMGITSHRGPELVLDERPFVLLDIQHLPFKSKSVDYVYCSHVIEHVDSPEQACAEMIRVGKAGYVETPTLMKDALFSWAKEARHRWHVVQFGQCLVFFEYDQRRVQGVRSTEWRDAVLSTYYHPNQDLFYPNQDLFNTILEWTDRFDVVVFRLGQTHPASSQRGSRA